MDGAIMHHGNNNKHHKNKTKAHFVMYQCRRNPANEKGIIIMAMYRKLGKATKPRRALLRNQVTALLYNGKIVTTEARAKEIKKIVEPMITLAAKEKDNFETVTVEAKVPEKDKDGRRVKEVVDGKKVTKFTTVKKEIKKDMPSRMHARRQLLKTLYPVVEVPTENAGRKKNTKNVDLVAKLFDEYGPKYADRKGGYTRMIKIGQRKGDAAMMVVLELV
ncbi:large subunit ribosomal protein L17 [Butyrivibrio sp. YAB3001]|nr:large subunit ribosomal protein L17 [Butyrivibrio sp. YAB3001]